MEENNLEKNKLVEIFGKEKRWVNWEVGTKRPLTINGSSASTTNPSTWSTYEEALKSSENIGIVFISDQKLLGIDIDHCILNNELLKDVETFVEKANTYTEISQSGEGLHLIISLTDSLELSANRHNPYEVYTSSRYFIVTQNVWGLEKEIRTMTPKEAVTLLETIGYPWETKKLENLQTPSNLIVIDDASLLKKMFSSKNGAKIKSLYDGDITLYNNDDSVADMAFCSHLAFWTGRNAFQMEKIWLSSPLGQREKTQSRKDYRDRTISNAIRDCHETYNLHEEAVIKKSYPPSIKHSDFIVTEFPPARYVVDMLCEKGAMNMISAPPNGWKSWWIFLLAGKIVTGTPLFDKFPTEKNNVMIVNEEDIPFLIQDRLKKLGLEDPSLPIYYRIAQGLKLTDDFINNLIEEAKDKNIGVIMFDSLRAIHDSDENSSKEMQVVLDQFKKINREGITVVFTHHNKKSGQFRKPDDAEMSRGSTAINASISGHISLEETKKEGSKYLIVKHLKSKAGQKLEPFDVKINFDENNIKFEYSGEHQPQEKALNEAKLGILHELETRQELMGRKDFVVLNVAGTTSIRDATKMLESEGKIKSILRENAGISALKLFNDKGKSNEKLYYIDNKDEDFDNLNKDDS